MGYIHLQASRSSVIFIAIQASFFARTRKDSMTCQKFATADLYDAHTFWDNVLWTDDSKVEMFEKQGSHYIWHTPNRIQQKVLQMVSLKLFPQSSMEVAM